ncbi:hypothetical protein [Hymenobacter sp. 102]|uniref:hypothetical protein n=1 Tax=Hymenobacter sp. 102 TaxID=3403152 RepID=UPI003CEA5650
MKRRDNLLRTIPAPLVAYVSPKHAVQQHTQVRRLGTRNSTGVGSTVLGVLLVLAYLAGAAVLTVLCLILWPVVPALSVLAGLGVVAAGVGVVRTIVELLH